MDSYNLHAIRASSADGRGHAIVIGGSMAGLLAARALADHFERVTIIERDAYAAAPAQRKGVPQGHHLHVLLARGLEIVEEFFPGLRGELIAAGSPTVDTGADLAWLTPAGWGKPFSSGLTIQAFTRPLLDHIVRRRLAAVRHVRFVNECEVFGLLPDAAGAGISGVALRHRARRADAVVTRRGRV
jgi:2-polyprenyl-6-methoxyphenol hydroxylase-like FAD-dependent oxidoreductase